MNTRWWRRKLKLKVVFSILWKWSLPVFVRLLYLCLICLPKKCLSSHYKKCTGTHTTSVKPSSQPGHHILLSPFISPFSFHLSLICLQFLPFLHGLQVHSVYTVLRLTWCLKAPLPYIHKTHCMLLVRVKPLWVKLKRSLDKCVRFMSEVNCQLSG